jgi:hypothetical protein
MPKYSQVKLMTLEQCNRITSDEYFRGNFGEGKEYFDQRFEILHRKYDLEYIKQEKMLKQREKEEFEYEYEQLKQG